MAASHGDGPTTRGRRRDRLGGRKRARERSAALQSICDGLNGPSVVLQYCLVPEPGDPVPQESHVRRPIPITPSPPPPPSRQYDVLCEGSVVVPAAGAASRGCCCPPLGAEQPRDRLTPREPRRTSSSTPPLHHRHYPLDHNAPSGNPQSRRAAVYSCYQCLPLQLCLRMGCVQDHHIFRCAVLVQIPPFHWISSRWGGSLRRP